jgi:hypothetical protein
LLHRSQGCAFERFWCFTQNLVLDLTQNGGKQIDNRLDFWLLAASFWILPWWFASFCHHRLLYKSSGGL